MVQRALKVSSLLLVLHGKREGKEKSSLATATKKCIEVTCKEHGNRSKPEENWVPYMFSNGLSLQHQKLWNAANINEPELFAESLLASR